MSANDISLNQIETLLTYKAARAQDLVIGFPNNTNRGPVSIPSGTTGIYTLNTSASSALWYVFTLTKVV